MYSVIGCITQTHDIRLVLLAALICGLGSFATVILLARAQEMAASASISWVMAASAVFGCSIWSLHFIAMLAYRRELSISYDLTMTVVSVAIAAGGAFVAFLVWRLTASRIAGTILSGTILGIAIAGMHYLGVEAMRLPGRLVFDHPVVAMSILLGVAFGILAMARVSGARTAARQCEAALWMGLSVFTLHFVGMTALHIAPGATRTTGDAVLGSGTLAIAVAALSLALLAVSLAATMMEKHLAERTMQDFRRMRLLNNLAHEVMIIHRDGIVLEVNSAGSRLFGMPIDDIIGQPIQGLFAKDSVPIVLRAAEGHEVGEIVITTATGRQLPAEFTSRTIDFNDSPATAIALRDLSERRQNEERIAHLAHHDLLTDLPGRFLLRERLGRAIEAAIQDRSRVAVLHLDLDRFKPINDLVGHAGGDAVLVEVGDRLMEEIRATDTVARVGSDEFVIVLANADVPTKVSAFARRLIDTLDRPFAFKGRQVSLGASIGIALYPGDGESPEALIRAADAAMYRAKETSRGSVRFFEAAMDADLQNRRQLEQELRNATRRGEMALVYQPLVDCVTGDVKGFEALLRWRHPQRGMVSPGEFIPLAEDSGVISQIGHWTIDTACQAAASWAEARTVAVNVSPSQFRNSDVPAIVAGALTRTGLDPARLEIEITEGIFIDDAERAVSVLSRLRMLGVRLSLDDFGTGYSALSYLRLFTFDKIKIDQSFLPGFGRSEEATTIVNAIIALGHNLGLCVIAEGVETKEQLELLRAQGADQVQGYLIGRPAAMETFSEKTFKDMKASFFPPAVDASPKAFNAVI